MNEHSAEKDAPAQCRYMAAAYPILGAEDTCSEHRHDAPTFALARAMAVVFQETDEPTDEQIGWFLDDAAAVVEDFEPAPLSWTVTPFEPTREPGLDWTLTINGAEYVMQQNDSGGHVVTHPVSREQWDEWTAEDEDDWGCDHDWLDRPESDTHVCQICGVEGTGSPPGTTVIAPAVDQGDE